MARRKSKPTFVDCHARCSRSRVEMLLFGLDFEFFMDSFDNRFIRKFIGTRPITSVTVRPWPSSSQIYVLSSSKKSIKLSSEFGRQPSVHPISRMKLSSNCRHLNAWSLILERRLTICHMLPTPSYDRFVHRFRSNLSFFQYLTV